MIRPGKWRNALAPLTPLYRAALLMRERRLQSGREIVRRLPSPVVSIGNLSIGGAGKTPLVIALARGLRARGIPVDVLSRGYGRQNNDTVRVDPAGHPEAFGDEPLLITRKTNVPVYVAPQRYEAGMLAEKTEVQNEPGVHILDDGFQHRQLHRDVDILLLNRADWQDRLLPAGNLREPLTSILRAHILAIPAEDRDLASELQAWGWEGPIWRLQRHMQVPSSDRPMVAFCGIARPAQFFAGLRQAGLPLAATVAFPDHHRYSPRDVNRLVAACQACGAAALVTTEKDAVRWPASPMPFPLFTAELRCDIEQEAAALDWLISRLRSSHSSL